MKMRKVIEDFVMRIGDLYDENGIKTDPRSLKAIQYVQNLQDNLQFLNILNFSCFDKYWYIKVEHISRYEDGYSSYIFKFEHDNVEYRNILEEIMLSSSDRIKRYLYHVNNQCLQPDDYQNFINNVFDEFNKTLDPTVYVRYLQSTSLFKVTDYYINNKAIVYNKNINFKCVVDLDQINGESAHTPMNIVEVETRFIYDEERDNYGITLTFSLPDLIIDNSPMPTSRRPLSGSRSRLKRDSIEDKTVAKAIEEFYLKTLFSIINENLKKL
jgi:hypothetical protein